MTTRAARDPIYRGRHCVLRYVPEYERRWSRFARSPGSSWRMDETAVSVRGGRHYLYRAVDRHGKSVASLLCNDRSMEAAQAFFRAAVSQDGVPWPEKVNVNGNSATHRGLRFLRDEDHRWQGVEVRAQRYLNNGVAQDHRFIKHRCAPTLGLKGFHSAAITLAAMELAHRIRKQQFSLPIGVGGQASSLKESRAAALATSKVPACVRRDHVAPMHQNPGTGLEWPREHPRIDGQVRYPRKISFGGSLYLLVRPQVGRYWHYHYRYGGKRKTLSLGTYPDVPTASRSRVIAPPGGCWRLAWIRPYGGGSCGRSGERTLRLPPTAIQDGVKPGRWFAARSNCSLTLTQIAVS